MVAGPVQVHQQMTNATDVRGQLAVLAADGKSTVQYGNLLSLPFDNGMLYVEPVYVKSNQQNAYPLLQRVLLSYGDGSNAVLASSLQQGIKDLVAKGDAQRQPAGQPPTTQQPNPPPPTGQPPARRVAGAGRRRPTGRGRDRRGKAAQASGDLAAVRQGPDRPGSGHDAFLAAQRNAANRPVGSGPTPTPTATPPAPTRHRRRPAG